jgi:hypothetical protein
MPGTLTNQTATRFEPSRLRTSREKHLRSTTCRPIRSLFCTESLQTDASHHTSSMVPFVLFGFVIFVFSLFAVMRCIDAAPNYNQRKSSNIANYFLPNSDVIPGDETCRLQRKR